MLYSLPADIIDRIFRFVHQSSLTEVMKEMNETYEYECENQHESIRTYHRKIKDDLPDKKWEYYSFIPEVVKEENLNKEKYTIKFVNVMDESYQPGFGGEIFWCEFFPSHRLHLHKTLYPKT